MTDHLGHNETPHWHRETDAIFLPCAGPEAAVKPKPESAVMRDYSDELTALIEAVQHIRRIEEKLETLKEHIAERTQDLSKIADRDKRMEAAVYAYCFLPEVNANLLGQLVSGRNHSGDLLRAADEMRVPCADCGKETPVVSRAKLRDHGRQLRKFYGSYETSDRRICAHCLADRVSRQTDHQTGAC